MIFWLVPMLIPEILGGDLYYTMYYLVQRDYIQFGQSLNRVLFEAGAIALGIIRISYIAGFARRLQLKVRGENARQ